VTSDYPGPPQGPVAATGIARRAVSASIWSAGSRISYVLCQFVATIVLARLLSPHDFGLAAMVAAVANFVTLLNDFGLAASVVQRQQIDQGFLSTVFWMNAALSVVFAVATWFAAPLLAQLLGQNELVNLTRAVAPAFLISLGVVHLGLLERALAFRAIAITEAVASALATAAAIVAAAYGAGAYSLIVLTVVMVAARHAGYVIAARWVPSAKVSSDAARGIVSFGGWLTAAQVCGYWSRNADNLIIGGLRGTTALGYYSRAYALMLAPLAQITLAIGRAAYPALALVQHDRARLREGYLRTVSVVALVSLPVVFLLLGTADDIVPVLLGPKWRPAIRIFAVLSIAAVPQVVGATIGWIYQAVGRTRLLFGWTVASTAIAVTAFLIGIRWGAVGVATAYAVATYLLVYPSFAIPGRLIGMRVVEVWRRSRGPFGSGVAAVLVIRLTHMMTLSWTAAPRLLVELTAGGAVYVGLTLMVQPSGLRDLRNLYDERRRRSAT
jgi:PST family polysaccharide transporter